MLRLSFVEDIIVADGMWFNNEATDPPGYVL